LKQPLVRPRHSLTRWPSQKTAPAIAHYRDGGGLLIEHCELPEAACSRLLDHFRLRYGRAQLARMREVACFDAKAPTRRYVDDSEAKRNAASAEIRHLAATMLAPLHAQLDALRTRDPSAVGSERDQ